MKFLIIAALFMLVAAVARSLGMWGLRWIRRSTVGAAELLATADGRPVILSERHANREALRRIVAFLDVAHAKGYRILGVEVCPESHEEGGYSGLKEEVALLKLFGNAPLSEYDVRSSLDPDETGNKKRMNRMWYMRHALKLGWSIVPIDPHHWKWISEDADGYLHSREPAMVEAIRNLAMVVAVVGHGHLLGLATRLRTDAMFALADPVKPGEGAGHPIWEKPLAFAATIQQLDI